MQKAVFFAILTLSILANGYFIHQMLWGPPSPKNSSDIAYLIKKYPYLSKRTLADLPNDYLINFFDLRRTLIDQVDPYKDTFAMYFEYLPTGSSIGVNSMSEFPAASLLKVPVAMAYYHQIERTGEPDKKVKIRSDEIDNTFGTLWKSGPGFEISLQEAIKKSIIESDNTAARVVTDNVHIDDFKAIYNGLDIELREGDAGVILTARAYSSILKSLFFASLISRDHSQEILSLMTKSIFNDKLPAGVHDNIPIAHKIGVYGEKLYSDCGIVYLPRRPYLLCMISASDEDTARDRMMKMSKTIYEFVNSR